jgi:cupin fold WbuC family metalloprotein
MISEAQNYFLSLGLVKDYKAKSLAFFMQEPLLIDHMMIQKLKEIGEKQNSRICLHKTSNEIHQDMLVFEHKSLKPNIHRHVGDGETWLLLEGVALVSLFDSIGGLLLCEIMRPGNIFRVPDSTYHSILSLSETILYFESKKGPFIVESSNEYPIWDEDIHDRVQSQINKKIESYLSMKG